MTEPQDTEITLGTGKMLILFFGLVALCSVFFALGYKLGRASTPSSASGDQANPASVSAVSHPSPLKPGGSPAPDLAPAKTVTVDTTPAQPKAPDNNTPASTPPATTASDNAPPDPMTMPATNAYYVQVAAVSKQEDADALVDALKKKEYAAASTTGADKLFHVQIGPFADVKDAEATRAKLVADGYNPILKK